MRVTMRHKLSWRREFVFHGLNCGPKLPRISTTRCKLLLEVRNFGWPDGLGGFVPALPEGKPISWRLRGFSPKIIFLTNKLCQVMRKPRTKAIFNPVSFQWGVFINNKAESILKVRPSILSAWKQLLGGVWLKDLNERKQWHNGRPGYRWRPQNGS